MNLLSIFIEIYPYCLDYVYFFIITFFRPINCPIDCVLIVDKFSIDFIVYNDMTS